MSDETVIIVDKVELRASSLFLRSDGIMYVHIKNVDEFRVDDMKDIGNGLYLIGGGKKFLNIGTIENFPIVDKEARKFSASEAAGKYTIADAIVVKSTALRLLVNAYISFNKPYRPTKMFDSEEKAVEWLKSFMQV